jgi:hypothetical protein
VAAAGLPLFVQATRTPSGNMVIVPFCAVDAEDSIHRLYDVLKFIVSYRFA